MSNGVNIADLIHRGGVYKDVEGSSPKEIYEKICKTMPLPDGLDSETLYKALCAREDVMSTAVGNGIAFPHSRNPLLKDEESQRICVVYLKNPLNMNAPDERSVNVMFILLSQNTVSHGKMLSSLAGLVMNSKFRHALELKADEETLAALIRDLN